MADLTRARALILDAMEKTPTASGTLLQRIVANQPTQEQREVELKWWPDPPPPGAIPPVGPCTMPEFVYALRSLVDEGRVRLQMVSRDATGTPVDVYTLVR